MLKLIRCLAKASIAALIMTSSVWGQTAGRITGVVTDPTGAVLPGVSVKLTNIETGVKLSAASDAQGVPVGHLARTISIRAQIEPL